MKNEELKIINDELIGKMKAEFPHCQIENCGSWYCLDYMVNGMKSGFIMDFRKVRNPEKFIQKRKKDFERILKYVGNENFEYKRDRK